MALIDKINNVLLQYPMKNDETTIYMIGGNKAEIIIVIESILRTISNIT